MIYIFMNIVPILAATAAGLGIGALRLGLSTDIRSALSGGRGVSLLLLAVLLEFWLAAILAGALILAPVQADRWTVALGTAVIIWIGFVMPTLVVTETFRGRSIAGAAGDSLFWLALMLAQAAVLRLFPLIASTP